MLLSPSATTRESVHDNKRSHVVTSHMLQIRPNETKEGGNKQTNKWRMEEIKNILTTIPSILKGNICSYSHHESESHSIVSESLWPHGYTVHGILQARIPEWITFPFFRGSSQPRDRTQVSRIPGEFFYQLSPKGSLCILIRYHQFTKINKSYPWMYLTFTSKSGKNKNLMKMMIVVIVMIVQMVIAAMELKDAYSLEGKLWPT